LLVLAAFAVVVADIETAFAEVVEEEEVVVT